MKLILILILTSLSLVSQAEDSLESQNEVTSPVKTIDFKNENIKEAETPNTLGDQIDPKQMQEMMKTLNNYKSKQDESVKFLNELSNEE